MPRRPAALQRKGSGGPAVSTAHTLTVPTETTVDALRVALVQTSAGTDVAANAAETEKLIADAPDCDLLALPEVLTVRGGHEDYVRAAEPLAGPTVGRLSEIASRRSTWILAGSIVERDGDMRYNTCVLIDREGKVAAMYRKIHLFEVHLPDGLTVREQDDYSAGREPVMADIEGWSAGLSICYDLRFPELYRQYSAAGASILFAPANFTQRTGQDHWEVLLRARAIENQCFVVAPDQCGANPVTGIESYGNSMVVDPWGKVLCRAGSEPCVLTAELKPEALKRTRARVPALQHRRILP
jgi:deaminated glutathione amidase